MSVYANGLNIQTNEVIILDFIEKTQNTEGVAARVIVMYHVLKQMHEVIGQVIQQYEAGLHMAKSGDMGKAN